MEGNNLTAVDTYPSSCSRRHTLITEIDFTISFNRLGSCMNLDISKSCAFNSVIGDCPHRHPGCHLLYSGNIREVIVDYFIRRKTKLGGEIDKAKVGKRMKETVLLIYFVSCLLVNAIQTHF